jgi:hypothetical protein
MAPFLLLWIALASASSEPPWQDLVLTIFRDPGISSDTMTLCRVRVVNNGSVTWPGHRIRFEAEALEGNIVIERARGRFGLTLGPHETLETIIGFSGRYQRFSVRPLPNSFKQSDRPRRGKRFAGKRRGHRARGITR